MASASSSVEGVEQAQAQGKSQSDAAVAVAIKAARDVATYIRQRIQASAPVGETGALRDSWEQKELKNGAQVFSRHPAAHRIEWGFVGQDALGRSYNQPPDPYVKPSMSGSGGLLTDKIESFFK